MAAPSATANTTTKSETDGGSDADTARYRVDLLRRRTRHGHDAKRVLKAIPIGPKRPRADDRDGERTPMQWTAGTERDSRPVRRGFRSKEPQGNPMLRRRKKMRIRFIPGTRAAEATARSGFRDGAYVHWSRTTRVCRRSAEDRWAWRADCAQYQRQGTAREHFRYVRGVAEIRESLAVESCGHESRDQRVRDRSLRSGDREFLSEIDTHRSGCALAVEEIRRLRLVFSLRRWRRRIFPRWFWHVRRRRAAAAPSRFPDGR